MESRRLTLTFPGFSGSAAELVRALREGRVAPAAVPIARLLDEALARAAGWPLADRAALAAELALLLLLRLGIEERLAGPEAGEATTEAVRALAGLETALKGLRARAERRRGVIPVPPAPLPPDLRLAPLSPRILARLAPPRAPRLPALRFPAFGLKEAWRRLRALLAGGGWVPFDRVAPRRFVPRAVHLAALLEAARRGWVRLMQPELYGPIEVRLEKGGGADIG